jgi:hypothetical protein
MQPTEITWPKFENTYTNRAKFTEKSISQILNQYSILPFKALKHLWENPELVYHRWEHARFLCGLAAEMRPQIEATDCNFEHLILAIIFHDAIYTVGNKDNEHLAAELFRCTVKPEALTPTESKQIEIAIRSTAYGTQFAPYHFESNKIAWWLQKLDLYQLTDPELRDDQLLNWIKVWSEVCSYMNKDKALFEKQQNEFLAQLGTKFGFQYRPISWKEIQEALDDEDKKLMKKNGPIDIDDLLD